MNKPVCFEKYSEGQGHSVLSCNCPALDPTLGPKAEVKKCCF